MNFFYGGSSYRCYKCTGMFYILHPNQTMECQVWLLMDEKKNAQTPPTIRLLSSHHHPSHPIATEKSRTASLRLDLPVCTLVILSNVSAGNPTPRVPPTLALVYV